MQLLFYYLIYSFGGWLLENTYNWWKTGIFLKDNFLKLPMKPMYGIAPILLVYSLNFIPYWPVKILLCFFIPTFVEYISGLLLEKFTGRKWWNYFDEPFNFSGHICLKFSFYWGLLCFGILTFIHPIVAHLYTLIPSFFNSILLLLFVLISLDILFTLVSTFSRYRIVSNVDKHPIH